MKKIITILLTIGIMLTCATSSVFAEENMLLSSYNPTNAEGAVYLTFNAMNNDKLIDYYEHHDEYDIIYNNAIIGNNTYTYKEDISKYISINNGYRAVANVQYEYINHIKQEARRNDLLYFKFNESSTGAYGMYKYTYNDELLYELLPYKLNINNNNITYNQTAIKPYKDTFIYYEGYENTFSIPNGDGNYNWYLDGELVANGNSYTYIQDDKEHTLEIYEMHPGETLYYDESIINNSIKEDTLPGKLIETSISQSVYSMNLEYLRSNSLNSHKVYAPDLADVYNALGTSFTPEQASKYFFDSDIPVDKLVWLRSGVEDFPSYALCVNCLTGKVEMKPLPTEPIEIKPVFKIDLTQVDFEVN